MWHDLIAAVCLVMVIEGILPFLSPGTSKKMAYLLAQQNNRSLRTMGLISMLLGVGVLSLVNG